MKLDLNLHNIRTYTMYIMEDTYGSNFLAVKTLAGAFRGDTVAFVSPSWKVDKSFRFRYAYFLQP